jgi:hypothetical protein
MSNNEPASLEHLQESVEAIKKLLQPGTVVFTPEQSRSILEIIEHKGPLIALVETFDGNADTMVRMSTAWKAVEGFVSVIKTIRVILAFIVVLAMNWSRVVSWLQGAPH